MTAVTIRGTFKKDSRDNNGLEAIAGNLTRDKVGQHYVVGVVKWAGATISEDGTLVPAVKFLAIEPVDGRDAAELQAILDRARQARGLGRAEEEFAKRTDPTLFDIDEDLVDERPLGPNGQKLMPGEDANGPCWIDSRGNKFELDDPALRRGEVNASGEPVPPVPPASQAELDAEKAEAAGVPQAEFSGKADA